jgi:Cu2+-exporting ATPase
LTYGEFGVSEVIGGDEVLRIAASLESHSSHVIGISIVDYAKKQGVKLAEVENFKNIAGKGVEGVFDGKKYMLGNRSLVGGSGDDDGGTVVILTDGEKELGKIILADKIKPESKEAVEKLHALGVKTAMLTGDNEQVAKSVANELGIDTYFAQVLPENKYKHIKELQAKGNKVMMIGDGVNDAPALTQADVGVAIGAGTDVAVEAGDVVLTQSNPLDIVKLVVLARKVYRKMVENLVWAAGYNVLAIPAAAGLFVPFGFMLRPEYGAILMSLSSVIVVVNALSLRRAKLAL